MAGAALDRLTHRYPFLETKGESYRLQDANTPLATNKQDDDTVNAIFSQRRFLNAGADRDWPADLPADFFT